MTDRPSRRPTGGRNVPAVEIAAPARPAPVTIAFWLQLGTVATLIACGGLIATDAIHSAGLIDEAARTATGAVDPAEVSEERTSSLIGALVAGVPLLLVA